ncbi:MAG: ABC transporter permease [Candidatus Aminicenantes bacterium]|nr:ABC transporter permease [Candidatus Aminicenantes bacterium]
MFKNYLKTTFRNILRQRLYVGINLIGLTIGMTVCILMFLFVQYESSYDRFHPNAERIYRVISQDQDENGLDTFTYTPAPLAPALLENFSEIEDAVRFSDNEIEIITKGRRFYETVFFADQEIFDIFAVNLIQGDKSSALVNLRSLLISEKIANKYFPGENPIGQNVSFWGETDYTIAGVFENIPKNTHLHFDFLGSFENFHRRHHDQWGISNYFTYILLAENTSIKSIESRLPEFIDRHKGPDARRIYKFNFLFQPITQIHLNSHWRGEITGGTRMSTLYIFSAIALFVLLIACFNSINLSIARFSSRAQEVGMRKVIGANRIQLIHQFLGESFFLTLLSFPASLALVEILLPLFNSLSGKNLHMQSSHALPLLIFLLGILIFTALISGLYPAVFISSFQPVKVFKGTFKSNLNISFFRKILILVQFVVSLIFIISFIIISHQLHYMRTHDLGFKREYIVMIPINESKILQQRETIKTEFLRSPHISAATATSYFPGKSIYRQNYWKEGMEENEFDMIHWLDVDHDFITTFQLELIAGRDFNKDIESDIGSAYILNESAAAALGWDSESALNKSFELAERGRIIGVVKDFHFRSLHQPVEPLVLHIWPEALKYLAIKLNPDNIQGGLDHLKTVWSSTAVRPPFEFFFLDEEYDRLYQTEIRLGRIFIYLTSLSILIACLGLFGLISFSTEKRTKEIGIRKILGASAGKLVWILSKDFLIWIAIANLIAWPVAYFVMQHWLQNFAYRISPAIWTFLLSAFLVLVIAFITVGIKAFRSALSDPAETLRYE